MLLVPPLDRLPTPGNRAYLRARTGLRHTCDLVIAEGPTAPTMVTCSRPWSKRATRKTAAAA